MQTKAVIYKLVKNKSLIDMQKMGKDFDEMRGSAGKISKKDCMARKS